jgi:hypothetical protein
VESKKERKKERTKIEDKESRFYRRKTEIKVRRSEEGRRTKNERRTKVKRKNGGRAIRKRRGSKEWPVKRHELVHPIKR